MEDIQTEVLIIGGGPTGMLCGIYLDLLGIKNVVIERQSEISPHPKAHELSARSIEILGQLGISLATLKKEASPHSDASRILFSHSINQEIGEIDLLAGGNDEKYKTHLASPEPYLNLSQTALEQIIREKLETCIHSQLLLGQQWESLQEEKEGVKSLILNREANKSFSIRSQYVICADGAGSRSRKALGIEMKGQDKIDDFISIYFEHNLRDFIRKPAKLYWIMNPFAPGTFIAHHIERRWVYHFPIFSPYEKKEDFSEEMLKERILTALGDKSIPLEIKSISFWRMTCQMAQTFRKGRCFLAGDAAHRFPPTGGLGMNSGIGDAQNLCWKLALVLQNRANPQLLDSYESERRPVIELNSAESLKNYFKIWEVPLSLGLNPKMMKWEVILRNSFLGKLIPEPWIAAIKRKLSKKIRAILANPPALLKVKQAIRNQIEHFDRIGLDLGYYYEKGAIVLNPSEKLPRQGVSEYQPSIVPGVRFPHFWVCQEGKKVSSQDWLQADRFTLLCNDQGEAWWKQSAKKLRPTLTSLIDIRNIQQVFEDAGTTGDFKTYYPIEETPLLLIRPDGQVAWKPETLNIDINSVFEKLIPSL
ncbi:MAG: FAD-dependent monooxygenase [Bacteroidota bacterium]